MGAVRNIVGMNGFSANEKSWARLVTKLSTYDKDVRI